MMTDEEMEGQIFPLICALNQILKKRFATTTFQIQMLKKNSYQLWLCHTDD